MENKGEAVINSPKKTLTAQYFIPNFNDSMMLKVRYTPYCVHPSIMIISGYPDCVWLPLSAPWGLSAASHWDPGTSEVLQLPGNLLQTSVRPVLQGNVSTV